MIFTRPALLAALVMAGAAAAQPRVTLRACEVSGIAGRCATVDVFENRATRSGRKIGLNVVVVPALGPAHATDPVFWLEGGPGGAATLAVGPVVQQYFKGIRDDHDLVFIDQRGTGQSNPLKCGDIGETPADIDHYFGPLFPIELIRACRQKLEAVADLRQYTTAIAADDLDEVRAALGYTHVDLAGASYGTLTAQAYMRQYPQRVRAAFLIGYNLGGPATSRGMYFSVTCAESAPFISEDDIVAETGGTFLGDRRVRAHLAACREWTAGAVPRTFIEPVRSDVPVVMFAGDADGSTPPWFAAAAVKRMANGRVITAPHTGHQIDGPCTWNLMQAFIRNPSITQLDAACVESARRPPFATELPK